MAAQPGLHDEARPVRSARIKPVIATMAVLALMLVLAGAVMVWRTMDAEIVSTSDRPEVGHIAEEASSEIASVDATGREIAGASTAIELTARLRDGTLELQGRLPDQATATRVREVAGIVFGTSVDDGLSIDESVPTPIWAQVAGDVVASLPLISDGEIELTGDVATLRGNAGSAAKHSMFVAAVARILGPRVELVDRITIVELTQPELRIEKVGPTAIRLEGLVPSVEVAERIQDVMSETYVGHSFETALTFDADVEETYTLHSLPRLAGMFAKFPRWEVSYANGRFESSSAGAASFDFDSVELPMDTPILDSFAMSLIGVPALRLTVIGHTDSSGPEEYNQHLSEARAATVVEYLSTKHGVDRDRLVAEGLGESAPVASNDTAEGRTLNRRVDVRIEIPTG